MIEHDSLIDYKGPFPFLWVLSTIPPNYLNEVISQLDLILWWQNGADSMFFSLLNFSM